MKKVIRIPSEEERRPMVLETTFEHNQIKTEIIKTRVPHADAGEDGSLSAFRTKCVVAICSVTICLEGFNLSLPGPFFPEKAKEKGLSQTEIGIVVGSFDCANVLFSFVVASILSPTNIKFIYCAGVIWSSVGIACFGLVSEGPNGEVFFWSSLSSRLVAGIGASMLYSTVLPVAAQMFPERAGLITALIQTSIGLGSCIGPPLGSVLIPLGGFKTPFLVTSGLELLVFVLAMGILPARTSSSRTKVSRADYFRFFFKFSTLSVVVPFMFLFCSSGLRDSSYSLYFEENLGLSTEKIGYIFIATTASFLVAGPIVGLLVDHGCATYISAIANFTGPLVIFMFFIPKYLHVLEALPWAIVVLALNGLTTAALFGPSYLILEKVAVKQGFSDSQQRKTLAASSFNLLGSSGRAIGAFLFGGYLNDRLGFYDTCFVFSVTLAVTATWHIGYLFRENLIRRIYYTADGGKKTTLSLTVSYAAP